MIGTSFSGTLYGYEPAHCVCCQLCMLQPATVTASTVSPPDTTWPRGLRHTSPTDMHACVHGCIAARQASTTTVNESNRHTHTHTPSQGTTDTPAAGLAPLILPVARHQTQPSLTTLSSLSPRHRTAVPSLPRIGFSLPKAPADSNRSRHHSRWQQKPPAQNSAACHASMVQQHSGSSRRTSAAAAGTFCGACMPHARLLAHPPTHAPTHLQWMRTAPSHCICCSTPSDW